jgi:hypothetical protein
MPGREQGGQSSLPFSGPALNAEFGYAHDFRNHLPAIPAFFESLRWLF